MPFNHCWHCNDLSSRFFPEDHPSSPGDGFERRFGRPRPAVGWRPLEDLEPFFERIAGRLGLAPTMDGERVVAALRDRLPRWDDVLLGGPEQGAITRAARSSGIPLTAVVLVPGTRRIQAEIGGPAEPSSQELIGAAELRLCDLENEQWSFVREDEWLFDAEGHWVMTTRHDRAHARVIRW